MPRATSARRKEPQPAKRIVSTAGFGAGDPRPKNLAELIEGYNAERMKRRLREWKTDQPVGKEGFDR